ncbi:hypothetical protein D3C81_687940 [compost metagenome]
MKQVEDCLNRFFENKQPLKHKLQARWHKEHNHVVLVFHYQHLLLAYDTENKTILHQWWEVPTDKRNLEAAIKYLKNKFENGE